jgi:hypothetical protein
MDEPQGYRAPLCGSLTKRPLKGGIPHYGAYALWGVTTLCALPELRWYFIPIGLGIHALWAWLMRGDPHFVEVLRSAHNLPERFEL